MHLVWNARWGGRSGLLPVVVLSVLFHLLLLYGLGTSVRFSPARPPAPETFVRLVEPAPLPPPRRVLPGTRDPDALQEIPKRDVTRLPPIPKSPEHVPDGDGLPKEQTPSPSLPEGVARAPLPEAGSAPVPETAHPALEEPSDSVLADLGNESLLSPGPDAPRPPDLPGEVPSRPHPGTGLPGLPFAQAQDLQRLAKLFSDQEAEQRGNRDPISINTRDLRYFSYGIQILNKIETIWKYPVAAGRSGIGGEVVVDLRIRRDGTLEDLILVRSSGYRILDEEVFRAVRTGHPYAPLPTGIEENPFPMTIHFIYIANNLFVYRSR